MDPEAIVSSPRTLTSIDAACRRVFRSEIEAEGCGTCVLDGLRSDGFRRLRAFEGRSRVGTFVYALINRLAVDCFRRVHGRPRPPRAVSRLGPVAEAIYRLVCLKGFSFAEAYEVLSCRGEWSGSFEEYADRFDPVRAHPCPERARLVSGEGAGDDRVAEHPDGGPNPLEALLVKLDRDRRIRAGRVIRAVSEELGDEDRLLVRLVYGSDHSVASAARVLGVSPTAAGKRLRRVLTTFRERLLAAGVREP